VGYDGSPTARAAVNAQPSRIAARAHRVVIVHARHEPPAARHVALARAALPRSPPSRARPCWTRSCSRATTSWPTATGRPGWSTGRPPTRSCAVAGRGRRRRGRHRVPRVRRDRRRPGERLAGPREDRRSSRDHHRPALRGAMGGHDRARIACPRCPAVRSATTSCACSMPTGARRTTCRSARSTCSTTRCCASRCARARQAAAARPLGHDPGLNFLYAHMNRVIRRRDLSALFVTGPGHGGPGLVANTTSKGATPSATEHHARRRGHAPAVPPVLLPRRHPQSTSRPRRPAQSTRAGSSATRSSTPSAPPSTTRTCSSAASWATARRRPAAGRQLALEQVLRPADPTARCCRSCTSTATRFANPTVLARDRARRAAGP
jgi:hypothetical protein